MSAMGSGSGAVIHVGFWRPETEKVAEAAQAWPGAVLLSASALSALPPPIAASSSEVVNVDGLGFHVALSGFGYEIDDPSPTHAMAKKARPHSPRSGEFLPRGWVERLIRSKPEFEPLLREAGILDEESYLHNEVNLEPDERKTLALDRYAMVVGQKPTPAGILNNLHACPKWFLEDKLMFLNMTVRMKNVCAANEMTTIVDLAVRGYNGLLKLPNLGQGSVHGLGALLWEAFIHGDAITRKRWEPSADESDLTDRRERMIDEVLDQVATRQSPFTGEGGDVSETSDLTKDPWKPLNLIDGFIEAAQPLTAQDRGIWAARIGFRCATQTLQQIASQINLTRERVRQIENKIYNRVSRHPFWTILADKLTAHLEGRASPLWLSGLPAIDPWFKDVDQMEHPLKEIFSHLMHDGFSIIRLDDTPVITHLTVDEWTEALDAGKRLFRSLVREKATEENARFQIESMLIDRGIELRDELWRQVTVHALWARKPDGSRRLSGTGRTAESVVTAILEEAGMPLHYEEIHRRASVIMVEPPELRRLHQACHNVSVLFARGTYGLLSACPLSADELKLIEAEVEDIVAGADSSRQWHTSELFDELLDRGLDFDGRLTKYIINMALHNTKNFVYMRRMVWGLKDSWSESAAQRLDVRQAVMALLESEGRPLTTVEIREKLLSGRGVNADFQIHPTGNLIRIGAGKWGLADRDVKIAQPDQLLEQLARHLDEAQEGVHISEAQALLGDLEEADAQALWGYGKSKGMRVDRGQYIYPGSWSTSRRVWPNEAVRRALQENPGHGMTHDEICEYVSRSCKRTVPRLQVSQMLAVMEGAFYNQTTETWSLQSDADDQNEDDLETDQAD